MQGWLCHGKVEVSTDEREQAGYGEATLLAEDSGRGGDEWDIDAGVLPAATFEGNAVLLVAADAEVRGSGTAGGGGPGGGGGGVLPVCRGRRSEAGGYGGGWVWRSGGVRCRPGGGG